MLAGGGQTVADSLSRTMGGEVPLLGQVPLDTRLREGGDAGTPVVLSAPGSAAGSALNDIASGLAQRARGLSGRKLGISPV